MVDEAWYGSANAFLVAETRDGSVLGYVVGRGLRVDDHLIRLRRFEGEVTSDEVRTWWSGDETPIDLRVCRISAYGNDHDQWDPGLSAEVVLEGEGLNLIGPNTVLATSA